MVTDGTGLALPPRPEREAPPVKKRRPPTWLVVIAGLFVLIVVASFVNPSSTGTPGTGGTACVDIETAHAYNSDAVSEIQQATSDLQSLRFADAADHLMTASDDYASIADEFAAYPDIAASAQAAADDMSTSAVKLSSAAVTDATQDMYKAKGHIEDMTAAIGSADVNEC
jgi:hypothetical protein